MKKVILVAAIICAATFVRAAAMTWGITGIGSTPDSAAQAGWVVYFMDGSTYEEFNALSDGVGAFVAEKSTYSAAAKAGRGGVVNATGKTDDVYPAKTQVSGYCVIFDNSDATKATYFSMTENVTLDVPAAGDITFTPDFAKTSGWKEIKAGPGPGPDPVPEPTSGLLLVLGGAALALRRRRA